MDGNKRSRPVTHFLVLSFVALLLLSIVIFTLLGSYMSRKSQQAVYEIGRVYMSGMNKQMSRHFETVIGLRFTQADGIVSAVRAENHPDAQALYEELCYRAQVRNFAYLALCSPEGEFQTLYGEDIRPLNQAPFVEALAQGEQRVAVGLDAAGNSVVLFGVDATDYPIAEGGRSTGLVAAVPLEYITDFLSLKDEGRLMYYHILRPDGSFVIQDANPELLDFFAGIQSYLRDPEGNADMDGETRAFCEALSGGTEYSGTLEVNGEERQIYGLSLPYSEWYLVGVMPYGVLDNTINTLSNQRTFMTLLSCAVILIVLTCIFLWYFSVTRSQVRELEATRQVALEASRAKSEFLANMSHDIRTPMNAISGLTAVALAHMDDPKQVQNCLKKISLSSRHLLGLINDILDMSKIESGKLTLSVEQISLREVVEAIVNVMQPQVKRKKQSFEVHVDNIMTENVWCDSVRLNQVLLNLLSNATKYTPEGGVIQLSLSEEPSPRGEGYVRIHILVKDNGIGMTPEFVQRIYEPYSRADEVRVSKTQGTGLGMAITKYIVDAMEGAIDIRSEPGKGSEFALTFDLEKTDVPDTDMVLPPWNLLVVDDDELLCKTAVDTLRSIGARAEWVLSGEQALELVQERHRAGMDYHVILLDWKLPGMSGIQVAREIRRTFGPEVPILLISAYDWSDFESEAREAGIDGFISKPLFKSTLYHALRQYVPGEAEPEASGERPDELRGRRLLLAEDNELNWEVANELLRDLGAEPDWAEDGQICLDKFRQSPEGYYDAILMDLRMPHMNGYEATAAIRALPRGDAAAIPIIAMSADAFSDDVQRCLDSGMNAHIAKPIDVTELSRLLRRYLS